eukprot:11913315-Alexandrium_andersonii.AAC.1
MKLKESRPAKLAEASDFLSGPSAILENCWHGEPPAISGTPLHGVPSAIFRRRAPLPRKRSQ